MVSEMSLEGVWKVIGSFLDQLEIQYKFNLLSTLTWDFIMIKMKTYTWNSSVALLSPTCLSKKSIQCSVLIFAGLKGLTEDYCLV